MSKRRGQRQAIVSPNNEMVKLREQVEAQAANLAMLQEADAAARRELALEDVGWLQLGNGTLSDINRADLSLMIARSRLMFLRDPIINRAVTVQALYVWAQDVNIGASDPAVNQVVQQFLDDPGNMAEFTSHQSRFLKECDLQVLGNIFFTFFVDPTDGAVQLRTIPVDQIDDIICNPQDRREVWWYHRTWSEWAIDNSTRARAAYYPDWRKPTDAAEPPSGEVVDVPVYHVKVGCLSDMKFGLPETYQALDWAKAYKEFLEDRATISRALSRFVYMITTQGGARGVAAGKTRLNTTLGTSTADTNPSPTVGAAFISSAGTKIDTVKTSGATIDPEEGRRFLLMAAAAMGLPETFFGDVSTGNLATANSLDRPTELKFAERQALWRNIIQSILQFVIDQAIQAGALKDVTDRHVEVTFPSILERDIVAQVGAIVDAATLKGQQPAGTMDDRTLVRLLLSALGVDQVDELLDRIAPKNGDSLMAQRQTAKEQMSKDIAATKAPAAPGQQPPQGDQQAQPAAEAIMVEAVKELRATLLSIKERWEERAA